MVCSFGDGNSKVDLTPNEVNARTRVHEYGGVPYWVGQDGALFLGGGLPVDVFDCKHSIHGGS